MAESSSAQNNSEQPKIWTNTHTFAKSITFSEDQVFPVKGLSYDNYSNGSILFTNGKSWDVLRPNKNNQVLTFNARGLSWQTPNLSYIEGVLPVSKGGTGWSLMPDNGILINTGKDVLDLMPIPKERKILLGQNKQLSWFDINELSNEVASYFKTIKIIGNDALFEEFAPSFKLKDKEALGGLILLPKDGKLSIGVNTPVLRSYSSSLSGSSINLDYQNNLITFEINGTEVLKIDEVCNLQNVSLEMEQIKGILPVEQGGLGDLQFDRGDLIFAKTSKELTVLSPSNSEGYYLQIKGGLPVYAPLDKSGFDGFLEVPLVLSNSNNGIAPLRFKKSKLIEKSQEGSLEYNGEYLFFTNAFERKAIPFLTSNITGTAKNVTGIVSLENGGTGRDLSELAIGQILIRCQDGVYSVEQGNYGQVLMSQGERSLPSWRDVLVDLDTEEGSGLLLDTKEGVVKARLDQSINFNPTWQGNHTFVQSLNLKSKLIVSDGKSAPLKFETNETISELTAGDMWFDGTDLKFFNGIDTISITDKNFEPQSSTNEFVQSHYLTLAAGASVSENRKIKMKTPVPHLTTKGSLAFSNWKIRMLEILLDEPATDENAIFTLKCGNKILIDQGILPIGTDYKSYSEFNELIVSTGEFLQLECVRSGGSNYWSAFLLIDLL